MSTRDEYVQKLKAQLDQWNAELSAWEAKARGAQADAKLEYDKQLQRLRDHREQTLYQMKLVQNASLEAWQDLARGADRAWQAMQDAFSRARSHFDKS